MTRQLSMNGRDLFKKYSNIINAVFFIYEYLPGFLKKIILRVFSDGKLGVLLRYFDIKYRSHFLGSNVSVSKYVTLKNMNKFSSGDNLSIHEYCYIDAYGGIEVGNNVSIAHNCSLVSFNHTSEISDIPIKYNPTEDKPIVIGNDVWLGCGVRVLAGVVIEDRVIVAAGAVVINRLESGFLYAGVPARKVKKLGLY